MNTEPLITRIARECVGMRIRRLNRIITRIFDDALRPLGLKGSQFNLLVVAHQMGVAQPAKVCELLDLDPSTLSRNTEKMRQHGWLQIVPGEDARTQAFRLTPEGRKLLHRAAGVWEKAQDEARRQIDLCTGSWLAPAPKRAPKNTG
jgi:DNA-binding MarR family transcriptional regulator